MSSDMSLDKADPDPSPVPPPNHGAAHASELENIHKVQGSLAECAGNLSILLRELSLRLQEHEAQLGIRGDPPAQPPEYPPAMMRKASEWRSDRMQQSTMTSDTGDFRARMGACTPSRASPPLTVDRTRSATPRRKDVAALEVCQGLRRRMPDEAEGLPRKRSLLSLRPKAPEVLDTLSCFLVSANLVFMMVEVEVTMQHTLKGLDAPAWLWYLNLALTVLFVLEVVARCKLEGAREFACGRHWRWNAFDVIAVTAQVLDVLLTLISVGFIRILRMLRTIRAARIIKTARYVRDLRLMVAALAASMPSLTWALVLIIVTILMYAMFIMQAASSYIKEKDMHVNPALVEFYGSLPRSVLSLFTAVTGGKDWMDFAEPLREISQGYLISFAFFMVFVLLGMLNILTAVFVDSTNRLASIDADLVIMEQLDKETSALNTMKRLLQSADVHGTGTVSRAEFDAKLNDPVFKAEMQLIDLHMHEAKATFRLLDAAGDGEVDIDEMIHGLMRLKGAARALDMAEMLYESRRLFVSVKRLAQATECNFQDLRRAVTLAGFEPVAVCGTGSTGNGSDWSTALVEVCKDIADLHVSQTQVSASEPGTVIV